MYKVAQSVRATQTWQTFSATVQGDIVAPLRARAGQRLTWILGATDGYAVAVLNGVTGKMERLGKANGQTPALLQGLTAAGVLVPDTADDAAMLRAFVGALS